MKKKKKKNIRVYVSGPITGVKDFKKIFAEKSQLIKDKLSEFYETVTVYDPADKIGTVDGMEYEDCMTVDFAFIDCSDMIFLMKGWEVSSGANREWHYAMAKMKGVIEEADLDFHIESYLNAD